MDNKLREDLVSYYRHLSKDGDCPCGAHQAQLNDWAEYAISRIRQHYKVKLPENPYNDWGERCLEKLRARALLRKEGFDQALQQVKELNEE